MKTSVHSLVLILLVMLITGCFGGDKSRSNPSVNNPNPPPPPPPSEKQLPAISLDLVSTQVSEGNNQRALALTLRRTGDLTRPSQVRLQALSGTATQGSDFKALDERISFQRDEREKQVDLIILGDAVVEPDETLVLQLSEPVDATLAQTEQTLTLVNDDSDAPQLAVTAMPARNLEGNDGRSLARVRFSLSKTHTTSVHISYKTTDGSAQSMGLQADYESSEGQTVIPAGELFSEITVAILGDLRFEPDEHFTVGLTDRSAGIAVVGDGAAEVVIVNDDQASAFRVGASKQVGNTRGLCTGGYGIFCGWFAEADRPNAIGERDVLTTRALAISAQAAATQSVESVVIITTSAIGIFAAYKDEIAEDGTLRPRPGLLATRQRIADELGISYDRVFIQADHSHRAPDTIGIWGGVPAEYYQQIQDDMVKVAREAWANRVPAELYVGAVQGDRIDCPDRYVIDADDTKGDAPIPSCQVSSLYSFDPNKVVDNEFRLMDIRAEGSGKRIAALVNYSPHATVLDDTGSAVLSGDWTAWTAAMFDNDEGAVGFATVATLGRTDFNPQNNVDSGDERNLNRERAARARLRYFIDTLEQGLEGEGITPMQRVQGDTIASREWFIREPVTNPVFYANYAPFVTAPGFDNPEAVFQDPSLLLQAIAGGEYPNRSRASIDRSVSPPFLTGNLIGTFAGAFRIGQVLFATAPGEEFPNAQIHLRNNAGVRDAQMHFFLGATNDFLGYMGPAESYDQVVAQGATYFFCPPGEFEQGARDLVSPITNPLGYEAGRLFDERSCPDHFILMSSPTIGDHVLCSIQRAAGAIGFSTGDENPACQIMTLSDDLLPPTRTDAPPSVPSARLQSERDRPATLSNVLARLVENIERFFSELTQGQFVAALGQAQFIVSDLAADAKAMVSRAFAALLSADPAQQLPSVLVGISPSDTARAGVAVVDMTPDVGYCAGQYCSTSNLPDGLSGDSIDPFLTHKAKRASYGVQSRLTARAIVIEGTNKKRIALIKTDNYLAQDALLRRVGQLLEASGSSIRYEQILHTVTHNHSSSYSATPSWGVWIFQDIFDPRFFERQARAMSSAIRQAEASLVPVRMGATTVKHTIFKGNVVGKAIADDGTPAGYPSEYGDFGLVVMRFDDMTDPSQPKPLATWMNWGQHPESLDGYDLHSADYLSALERFIDRETGAPVVFSQGDVGSAESSGNKTQLLDNDGHVCGTQIDGVRQSNCPDGEGVLRDSAHQGYAQMERNVRFLANDVLKAWHLIGDGGSGVTVPLHQDFVVDYRNAKVPGPLSHPYPSVSNCKSDRSINGDLGIPVVGFPDCGRFGFPGENSLTGQLAIVVATLQAEGFPVPDHYDAPAFTAIEENLRISLQTMRIGEVLLASCSCEAQVDLILNLESRTN